jgi:hypothetical protein
LIGHTLSATTVTQAALNNLPIGSFSPASMMNDKPSIKPQAVKIADAFGDVLSPASSESSPWISLRPRYGPKESRKQIITLFDDPVTHFHESAYRIQYEETSDQSESNPDRNQREGWGRVIVADSVPTKPEHEQQGSQDNKRNFCCIPVLVDQQYRRRCQTSNSCPDFPSRMRKQSRTLESASSRDSCKSMCQLPLNSTTPNGRRR